VFLLSLGVSITGNTAVKASADAVSQASGKAGEIMYNQHCAACHDGPVARAPHKIMFSMLGPETILTAINKGIMQAQAEGLTAQQKIDLSEYLGGRAIQSSQKVQPQFCENLDTINTRSTPATALNGWGLIGPSTPKQLACLPPM
jgi:polyvinyl alcohol dehydrogenase (cytochrome)